MKDRNFGDDIKATLRVGFAPFVIAYDVFWQKRGFVDSLRNTFRDDVTHPEPIFPTTKGKPKAKQPEPTA